jgi:hypothetical protein
MEGHPEVAMSGTARVDFHDGAAPRWGELPAEPTFVTFPGETVVVCNRFTTSTVILRADALREAGEFDEALFGPEDWDFWRRVTHRRLGAHLRCRLAAYRIVYGSVSSNPERMTAQNRKVVAKAFADNLRLPLGVRLRARSHLHLDAALMFSETRPSRALRELLASLLIWPFSVRPSGRPRWLRARLGTILILRLMGLRRTAAVREQEGL